MLALVKKSLGSYMLALVKKSIGLAVSGKVSKKAKIRIQYNQVPHLTQEITWESDKKITHKRVKRSALSHQVTTRLQ